MLYLQYSKTKYSSNSKYSKNKTKCLGMINSKIRRMLGDGGQVLGRGDDSGCNITKVVTQSFRCICTVLVLKLGKWVFIIPLLIYIFVVAIFYNYMLCPKRDVLVDK